jgi:hypothetical protein
MSTNQTPTQVLAEAGKIVDIWTANPDFRLGEVDLNAFTAAREKLTTAHATVESKRTELTGLVNARDDQSQLLHELVVRARSGFRATYGPDSTQYEQAGGTRASERSSGLHRGQAAVPAEKS